MLVAMTELPRRLIRISASLAAGGLSATVLATAADPGVEAPPPRGTVAFVSDRAPNRGGELYSVDAGGKRRNALTRAPLTADFALTPSHDRRKVAFVSNRDGTWAVWVMASQ